uniref:Uncharacterized protein n=1 Tax=Candidatus Kentrum sp. LFY TaxID=2126342 RepID=A0A450WUM1_9GAMM|nr:MAG: hypothetical protein BECKLFY1418C_GA0070996_107717 [Candidatus Kentron sp. LFY]
MTLQFADELGLTGPGVESLSRHWDSWARQCDPPITADAFLTDRISVRDVLDEKIRFAPSRSGSSHLLMIRADSVEEAAAFAVAVVMTSDSLRDQALVVSEPEGWRYVEANLQLRIAIAIRTEVAEKPILRKGLLVIIPHATGDLTEKSDGTELVLERPDIYEFEKALIAIGVEESDARRYAVNTGRSWTVFRRQRATNLAIRHPNWLDIPQSASLTLVCLLGAWFGNNNSDCQVVERLGGRSYEDIEQDLRELAIRDDAPVLHIGAVWKAKSPLELFTLFGSRITSHQLDRFFVIAKDLLSTPDPQLELPDEERWAAQVHGKVHPYSGLLFESVCDSLIKLAVRGPEQAELYALNIEDRVARLVRELLGSAEGERWLSLASYLSTLAEAAPNEFLRAVEKSLSSPDAPVTRLITETGDSGLMGGCWHCDLLWALERLAWVPNRLARVALILTRLSHVPIKGNWGNTPNESLFGLFRSWLPQTAANLSTRIRALELLIDKDEEAGFDILKRLVEDGMQVGHTSARPKWREDDAGAERSITYAEMHRMIDIAKKKILKLSDGNAHRIAALLQTGLRHPKELPKVLALMEPFTETVATGGDRETLRTALREHIHWHRNYDESPTLELNEWLEPVEMLYERLAPRDLVIRHRWLFDKSWLNLPCWDRDEGYEGKTNIITQWRISALTELYREQGASGVDNLIAACNEPGIVGNALTKVAWYDDILWPEWIAEKGKDFAPNTPMSQCIFGFLRSTASPASGELLQEVIAIGEQAEWDTAKFACFLVLARVEPETWQLVEDCGLEVRTAYWQNVHPYFPRNKESLEFALERLLEAKRPLTALWCCQPSIEETKPHQLFAVLQQLLYEDEADGPKIDSWHLAKALEQLEKSGEIEKNELIRLEFGLFPALGHGLGEKTRAAMLHEAITSEPSGVFQDSCRVQWFYTG